MINYSTEQRNNLLDEFLTPPELIEACMNVLTIHPPLLVLDVGANDGRWGKAVRKHFPNAHITGIEIMDMPQPEGYDSWIVGDFFTHLFPARFDLIIGNVAYRVKEKASNGKIYTKYKAEDFVRTGHDLLVPGGTMAFLLRTNFRHSLERYWLNKNTPGLLQTHPLCKVYDCVLRPSFYRGDKRTKQYGTKATNAHDYAFFMWLMGWNENYYVGKQLDWKYREEPM